MIDEGRLYLSVLLGPPAAPEADLRRALRTGDGAGDAALRGRLLALSGRPAEGEKLLSKAIEAEPRSARAWAWRGECRLLGGDAGAASGDLERAAALDPRWPWGLLLRGACRAATGDRPGAEKDLRAAGRFAGAEAAAAAVLGLMQARGGDAAGALRFLDGAVRRGAPAWLRGVRGLVRRDAGDLRGSLEDFDAAEKGEPGPWLYSHRADVWNRTGFYRKALEDLSRMERLLPEAAEPRVQAANVYFDQALYPEAMAKIEEAVRLAPKDVALRRRRARFLLTLGRVAEAHAELERAAKAAPEDVSARYERLIAGALLDRHEAVRADLARGGMPPALESYLRAYSDCRRRDYARAAAGFARAADLGEGELARRAGYFALTARVLARPLPPRGLAPRLLLCGIGIRHPYQSSVEALSALARCSVLYNNIGDAQISEFLGLFPGKTRAVTRDAAGTAADRARWVLDTLPRTGTAGFVTRIHPFIYRRIANDLVELCRARGVSFRSFGAVSLTEMLWGLAGGPGDPEGLRVFDIASLCDNPHQLSTELPAVVYCIADERRRRELARGLRARYPKAHRFAILAGSGDSEDRSREVSAAELEEGLVESDSGALLFVPSMREKT